MRIVLGAILALILAGCVTTNETVFTNKEVPDVALKRRVELARAYIGQGNWENAKRNLKLAADIDPNNAEVYEAFALVYQSTGEFEAAEANFRKALVLDKSLSRARNNFAAFLFGQQRFAEAEVELELVVRDTLYSGRPQAFTNLGLCRARLGKIEPAIEALERALTMELRNPLALLTLAQLYLEQRDYLNGQSYYSSYRKLVRTQPAAGLWTGVRLAKALQLQDEQASLELALQNLYPDSPEAKAMREQRTVQRPNGVGSSN
ncbi:type IV pilus biogenesis/stability protein PilW [Aequoribacter sp.]|uniref:type IV pilus biogenesis/stability protein PilW n=1 Tax=Aequoribacter sp. TaxID=2847771 RepID=UPI003F69DF7C